MNQPLIDFSSRIHNLNLGFVGREWLLEEVDKFVQQDLHTYLVITGEPGIGKSAIAAHLTQVRDVAAYHFCIARQADTINPALFVRSLSRQLCRFDGFARGILKDSNIELQLVQNIQVNYGEAIGARIENLVINAPSASDAFTHTVTEPLKALYESGFDQPIVILIDALDEAVQHKDETIVDLLANTGKLPNKVRFILTSRPDHAVLRNLEARKIPYLRLDASRQENLDDIRDYVSTQLAESQALRERVAASGISLDMFVQRLVMVSRGNFLYLVWLIPAIAAGTQSFDSVEALPQGLDDIYREFLRNRKLGRDEDRWRDQYRPLMGVLAGAQVALSVEQIIDFTKLRRQVVRDLLQDIGQFLEPNLQLPDQYQLYHQSVADFLADEERAREFWIDLSEIHRQIAAHGINRYGPSWYHYDDYSIEYTLYHLRQAIRLSDDPSQNQARSELERQEASLLKNEMFLSGMENAKAVKGFLFRDWVWRHVEAWLATPDSPAVFLLTGPPGSGKTVMAKQLVHKSRGGLSTYQDTGTDSPIWIVSNLSRGNALSTLDPKRFVQSIATQLAHRYPEFATAISKLVEPNIKITVPVEVETMQSSGVSIENLGPGSSALLDFERIVRAPLEKLLTSDFHATIIVLVDALDEAFAGSIGSYSIVDLLADVATTLPSEIRFILTSRLEAKVLRRFGKPALDLQEDAPSGFNDIRSYVYDRLDPLPEPKRGNLSSEIVHITQGNLLYTRFLLDEILSKPDLAKLDVSSLLMHSEVLMKMYDWFLFRKLGRNLEIWETLYRPVLGMLAVARDDGLTSEQLTMILGTSTDKIDDAIDGCGEFLFGPRPVGPFRLYHDSFREFLLTEGDHYVYPAAANQAIAEFYVKKFEGDWQACDDYGLRYTPTHLVSAIHGMTRQPTQMELIVALTSLLTNTDFLKAKRQRMGLPAVRADLQATLDLLPIENTARPSLLAELHLLQHKIDDEIT